MRVGFQIATVAAAVAMIMGMGHARADEPAREPARVPQPSHEPRKLEIAAQPLDDALNEFARQSGLQIFLLASNDTKRLRSAPVAGVYEPRAALARMLSNTGLRYEEIDSRSIAVVDPSSGKPAPAPPSEEKTSSAQESRRPLILAQAESTRAAGERRRTNFTTASTSSEGGASESRVEEVIVSAQKRGDERLQEVPVPVAVVDGAKLTENGQVLLKDFYSSVPGLNMAPNYNSQQNLAIRGITTGGLTAATVGIMVDEVPFQGYRVFDFDPGDLARIEVLRGPQGTLYGANSMGGLLKYVTREPSTDAFSARFSAGTSSVENGDSLGYNVRASANVPLGETLAVLASAYTRQDPGYIDNPVYGLDGVNEARSTGANVTALWRPSRDLSLKLSALYQRFTADGLNEVVLQPSLGNLQQNYLPRSGVSERTDKAFSAVLTAKLAGMQLTSVTGYNVDQNVNSLDWSFAMGARTQAQYGVSGILFVGHPDTSKFAQEVRLAGTLGSKVDWLTGVFYTKERVDRFSTGDAVDPATGAMVGQYYYTRNPTEAEEYAAFANVTYHFTDRFDVQVGGRGSHYLLTNDAAITTGPYVPAVLNTISPYRVAAQESKDRVFTYLVTPRFRFTPDLMAYARIASGFRPGVPNPVVPSFPSQSESDSTNNYEIGLKADFFDRTLSLDASLYYIDWQDMQVTVIDPGTRIVYTSNGGGAKSEGVELSLTSRPLTGLTIAAWASYTNAVLTQNFPAGSQTYGVKDGRLPFTPRVSGNLSLDQEFPLSGELSGFVGGTVSYVGERFGQFTNSPARQALPSYTRADLRAGVRANSWSASLYVNNLTDERGLLQGGVGYFYPLARIYITPRTIGLNVSKTY